MRRALMGLLLSASGASLLAASAEPELETHTKKIITVEGLRFNDLNANGRIDALKTGTGQLKSALPISSAA